MQKAQKKKEEEEEEEEERHLENGDGIVEHWSWLVPEGATINCSSLFSMVMALHTSHSLPPFSRRCRLRFRAGRETETETENEVASFRTKWLR